MPNIFQTHFKKSFLLAYPVMLSQLGHVLVGVVDSMMVGHIGAVPLAAASFGNAIFSVFITFGIGLSYGITSYVAAAHGEGMLKKVRYYTSNGVIINIIAAVLLWLIIQGIMQFIHQMNQPAAVVVLAGPYLQVIAASLLPLMFFQTFRQVAEGLSDTRQAMVIIILSNALNVVLNYIFIYGKLGLPAMGLLGAGYATLISRVLMALAMFIYVRKSIRYRALWAGYVFKGVNYRVVRQILSVGVPTGFQYVFEVGAFATAAIMIGWLGAVPLAAHQIAISLASISYMMASGLGAAAGIRVANQLGRRDFVTMRGVAFTIFWMALIFMGVSALMLIVGRNFLPTLFIDNQEVIEVASGLLIIAALFQLSDGLQVACLGALRGLTDVKVPTAITFVAYWLIGLPVGYFLSFKMGFGAEGIWYGLFIGLTLAAIMVVIRFNRLTKRMQLMSKSPKKT